MLLSCPINGVENHKYAGPQLEYTMVLWGQTIAYDWRAKCPKYNKMYNNC